MNNSEENNSYKTVKMDGCDIIIDSRKKGLKYKEKHFTNTINTVTWVIIEYEFDKRFNDENFKVKFDKLIELSSMGFELHIFFKMFDTNTNCSMKELNNQKAAFKVIKQALSELNGVKNKFKIIQIQISYFMIWGLVHDIASVRHGNFSIISDLSQFDDLLKKIDDVIWSKQFYRIIKVVVIAAVVILILIIVKRNNKEVFQ